MYKAVIPCILIFVLCEAEIKIKITIASNYVSNAKIEYEGEDNKNITDMEIKLFNFTEDNIFSGMRVLFGKAPEYIFWQNPTRYGNGFEQFKVSSPSLVKRNIKIEKARIINVFNQKKVILTTDPGKQIPEVHKWRFVNKINSTWSSTGLPNDKVYFDVDIQMDNDKLEYQDTWRNHTMINFVFSLSEEEYYKIQTGLRTINGRLTSIETIVLAEIEYSAKLIGHVVGLDYINKKRFRFYTPQVNEIVQVANIVNNIKTTQIIEIRYYTVPKFEVYDAKSDQYEQITLSSNTKYCDRLKVKLAEAENKLVVIYFMNAWCGQCEIIAPKIIQMADGIVLHTVDVAECKKIASEYKITSVPTFVFMKNFKKIEEISGANVNKLRKAILKHK